MGLFKRISDQVRANVNAALDRAEDPGIMMNQYLRDMEDDIVDAEGAVARQMAVARKFSALREETAKRVLEREEQAREALRVKKEDLARKLLVDKKVLTVKTEEYEKQAKSADQVAETLRGQLREMKCEYEQMKARRDTLAARAQAAKAQSKVYEKVAMIGRGQAASDFSRMEERVMELEAEASVRRDLGAQERSLEADLADLGMAAIDAELAALKASIKSE